MNLPAKFAAITFIATLWLGGTELNSIWAHSAGDGAKDLFYRQMARQSEDLNTGVQYWIELKRKGQSSRVNNKFDFQSGDRIRFHVKSNINGHAYVILREGSSGEHAVLFPDNKLKDDNRIVCGADYAIPRDDYLLFDAHPGSEKLILVLSRSPIKVDDYMNSKSTKPRVLVASAQPGSKDLVPGSAVVAFQDNDQIADLPASQIGQTSSSPIATASPHNTLKPSTTGSITVAATSAAEAVPQATTLNFITTVVEKNPQAVLALDIILTHKP